MIGIISNFEFVGEVFDSILVWIIEIFGWFYMLLVVIFLVFIVLVVLFSWGNIKLGFDYVEF